jgi:hypothetical protein
LSCLTVAVRDILPCRCTCCTGTRSTCPRQHRHIRCVTRTRRPIRPMQRIQETLFRVPIPAPPPIPLSIRVSERTYTVPALDGADAPAGTLGSPFEGIRRHAPDHQVSVVRYGR